jgi:8-oxo-dGTP pyrophosphatase MutT (NUDIX family)
MRKEYVLGFAFNAITSHIVLIHKQKPNWQKGKINAIGGKFEKAEIAPFAMTREFEEETGVVTGYTDWQQFATLIFENDVMGGVAIVHCMRLFDDKVWNCKTIENEQIEIFEIKDIWDLPLVGHLHFLIPMAMDKSVKYSEIKLK